MKKTIVCTVCALVFGVGALIVGVWTSRLPNEASCTRVDIQISDSADYAFVNVEELYCTLESKGLLPVGKAMDDISCYAIEECLLGHDLIRTAECYKSVQNVVHISVTQRVPMLYVKINEGNYYVDIDRKVMPDCPSVNMRVPIFTGLIEQEMATNEYYDFAKWLSDNSYWKDRITHVNVNSPEYIVLTQLDVEGDIILGKLDDFEQKMNKLRKLYVDGLDQIGYKSYKEYDLRFEGQVVGRK